MTALRAWLLSIVACAMLVSLAEELSGDGALRRVVRFTGGILLLLSLLRPMLLLSPALPELDLSSYREAAAQRTRELSASRETALAESIAEETGAYIEDKADELGLSVRAEVTTESVDGVPLPASVTLYGREDAALGDWLARELGIAKEEQRWVETEESASAQPP